MTEAKPKSTVATALTKSTASLYGDNVNAVEWYGPAGLSVKEEFGQAAGFWAVTRTGLAVVRLS